MTRIARMMVVQPAPPPRELSTGQRGRVAALAATPPLPIDAPLAALERYLEPHDVLIVNDAATLPASLSGHSETGAPLELRLLGGAEADGHFRGVLFGAGDFHTRTEDRPSPPALTVGDRLFFDRLVATITSTSPISPRLIDVRFDVEGVDAIWAALYRAGRPVQYAHEPNALPLWSVQTAYATRPWAAEMPSAGWPLSWSLLLALRRKGIAIAMLTHAAGLSAIGDPTLDSALPLPERCDLPLPTVRAVEHARENGGRVIAVGTSVVRALEGSLRAHGELRAGEFITDLVIEPGFERKVVDGLLTGVHAPGESHYRLLQAFAPAKVLVAALEQARALGYRDHEFGDSMLLLSERRLPVRSPGPRKNARRRACSTRRNGVTRVGTPSSLKETTT